MDRSPISGDTMTDNTDPQSTATGESNSSRRGFLARSALAGGALVALGGGAGIALADEHTTDAPAAAFDDVDGTDVDVLKAVDAGDSGARVSRALLTIRYSDDAHAERADDTFHDGHAGRDRRLTHVDRFIRMPGLIRLGVRSG